MDGYSPTFMLHNIPLLLISGLSLQTHEGQPPLDDSNVVTDTLKLNSEVVAALRKHLQDSDASNLPWNSRETSSKKKFRIKLIERDYTLPPRNSNSIPSSPQLTPTSKSFLHSTLSPLSPESVLFPDGLIDPKWIEKHQELVPCAFVSFYKFTSDPILSKKHDIQLKATISNERTCLSQSGYKSYLVIALISDDSMLISPEIEERLSSIRREAGLDAKTCLLFLSSQNSVIELEGSVNNLISKIYPACIEYYRDLSKHSRRKKNRGVIPRPTVPPTLGTSQTLSSHGWNVRYDFKLGVFAEFRQEMESALRSYESSYETLLGTDILEVIVSWSPRWNEARYLSDVLAFRMIRCLLWNGNYSSAVRRWMSHKQKIKDFVDRRGKGSATYGWAAWEARWATVMAETIVKVSVPEFDQLAIFLPLEKTISIGARTMPMDYLHHPGYWYKTASNHLIARRELALQIPEESRSLNFPSGPRSASTNYIYDTYMCPEPHEEYPLPGREGVDHASLILDALNKAIVEFEKRKQIRSAQELQLLSANELMKKESWCQAFGILSSLWKSMTYRKECWWIAVQEVLSALRKAALYVGDASFVITVDWELFNHDFAYNSSLPYDLENTTKILDLKSKQAVVLRNTDIHSFLTATFTFKTPKAKVGDRCLSQFVVYSNAISSAATVTMSKIEIRLESNIESIILKHVDSREQSSHNVGQVSLRRVVLSDKNGSSHFEMIGETFLSFHSESTTIFELSTFLKEPGEIKAISASFYLNTDLLNLEYIHNFSETNIPEVWWGEVHRRKTLVRRNVSSLVVLPKPPKLDLLMNTQDNCFCINETISLQLSLLNEEDFDSFVALDVQVLGDQAPQITMKNDPLYSCETYPEEKSQNEIGLIGTIIGKIARGKIATINITISSFEIPAKHELLIKASYHLDSSIKTILSKTMSIELQIVNPFEVTYDFSPRIHPDPWPSLFAHEENIGSAFCESQARGIPQKWCLTARYNLKIPNILIEDVKTDTLPVADSIQYFITKLTDMSKDDMGIPYNNKREVKFDIITQSFSLDKQATAILDMSLIILWRRNTTNPTTNLTKLNIPRLLASAREPRAIAELSYTDASPLLAHLDVMIENPSFHFLSFGLDMESGEDFAFSGTKQSILQLLPLSRKRLRFNILPSVRGRWLGPVHCLIRDRYFQKVLRVMPTEGMKYDKDRIMIWIPEKR